MYSNNISIIPNTCSVPPITYNYVNNYSHCAISSKRRDSSCQPFKLQLEWNYDCVLDRLELYLRLYAAIFLACRYLILAGDKLFGPPSFSPVLLLS